MPTVDWTCSSLISVCFQLCRNDQLSDLCQKNWHPDGLSGYPLLCRCCCLSQCHHEEHHCNWSGFSWRSELVSVSYYVWKATSNFISKCLSKDPGTDLTVGCGFGWGFFFLYVLQIIRFQWGKEYPYRKAEDPNYMEKNCLQYWVGFLCILDLRKFLLLRPFMTVELRLWLFMYSKHLMLCWT